MWKLGRSRQEWRKVMMATWLLTCLMVWMAMPDSKIRNGRKKSLRLSANGNGERHWAYWVWAICGTYTWRCLMGTWKDGLSQDPSLRNSHCKAPQAKASRLQNLARTHDLGSLPLSHPQGLQFWSLVQRADIPYDSRPKKDKTETIL